VRPAVSAWSGVERYVRIRLTGASIDSESVPR